MEFHTRQEIEDQCKLLLGINDSEISNKEKSLMIYFHEKILKKEKENPFNIKSCIICLEKLIDHKTITFTCHHKLCVECAKKMRKHKKKECPFCKEKIVYFIELYFTEKMYRYIIANYIEKENIKIIRDLITIFSEKREKGKISIKMIKNLFFSEYIYHGRFSINLLI